MTAPTGDGSAGSGSSNARPPRGGVAGPAGSGAAGGAGRSNAGAGSAPASGASTGARRSVPSGPVATGSHAAAAERPQSGTASSARPASSARTGATGTATRTASPKKISGPKRAPRLTTLQLKRLDPWTVLKISLIVSIVMFFVWMIAIGVLYMSLGSLDVWSKINSTYNTLVVTSETAETPPDLVTPGAVFGVTAVIGAVNVVLFTALSTIAAFVYNAAAGMAGGMELTLGERD